MIERLNAWAAARGCAVSWGPAEVVREAWNDISARRAAGELDGDFYRADLSPFEAIAEGTAKGAIVMVAWPVPAHRVEFDLGGERLDAILPPTYVRYRARFEDVRRDLAAHGLPGARVDLLNGPLKAIASRLGLVRYGRNNVTYAPKIGSYLQLCGFTTDAPLPAPEAADRGPKLLSECASCRACLKSCPMGAVSEDRVLLRAQRCLTFLNERPEPWPETVPAGAHNCLLGCLLCQTVCPANPPLAVEPTGLVFSEDETRSMLEGGPEAPRSEGGIRMKMSWLGQSYAEPVLGRNLRALVAARRGGGGRIPGRLRVSERRTPSAGALSDRDGRGD